MLARLARAVHLHHRQLTSRSAAAEAEADDHPTQVRRLLSRWRKGHRLNQAEACAMLGLPADQALLSHYERGNFIPRPDRMRAILAIIARQPPSATTAATHPDIAVRARPAQVAQVPRPHPRPRSRDPRLLRAACSAATSTAATSRLRSSGPPSSPSSTPEPSPLNASARWPLSRWAFRVLRRLPFLHYSPAQLEAQIRLLNAIPAQAHARPHAPRE